jgi:hypothetical protein
LLVIENDGMMVSGSATVTASVQLLMPSSRPLILCFQSGGVQMPSHPTCFISYSWDSSEHKLWVRDLAKRLRGDGIDVQLDQWNAVPGDQLPHFMESAVRENNYILIICTPAYKDRADGRIGGVGYEGDIITGEVLTDNRNRKVIPVLRGGLWTAAAPSFCLGKYYIDLSSNPYAEKPYRDLLSTLLGNREQAPPLGPIPHSLLRRASLAEGADKRTFYPIEHGIFPVLTDSDSARGSLIGWLRDSLMSSFLDRQARFAVALCAGATESNGVEVPYYAIWSHQKKFVFEAARAHEEFLRRMYEAKSSADASQEMREKFRRTIMERERAASGWKVEAEVAFDRFPRAHWITYEPSVRRIQIKVDHRQSADPKEYDNKVGSTSEALTYACALAGSPLAFVGDIAWQSDNFSLLKLTCFILDRKALDFARFRILEDDPEVWDFRYPELEAEVEGRV